MLDREQLETFVTVVEEGSFERAAAVLNVTRGAVSQRIKALEDSVATVLVLREKPTRATERGEILLRYARAMRLLEGTTLSEMMANGDVQAGTMPVAIAVNADSMMSWFWPVVTALMANRSLALEIITDDQDHTHKRLSRGEVVGCVSTEAKPMRGYVATLLGAMEYRCVASPAFAARHFPRGLSVHAVLSAPAVLFDRKDSLHDTFLRQTFGFVVDRFPRHYVPQPDRLLHSIVESTCYGMVPLQQAQQLLDAGKLVELQPSVPQWVDLYWHHWKSEVELNRQVTALVTEAARAGLAQRGPGPAPSAQYGMAPTTGAAPAVAAPITRPLTEPLRTTALSPPK